MTPLAMKRCRTFAVAVLGCLVCVAAHAQGALEAIRTRGTLIVGTTGDYKPFSFRQADGTYVGADIEMARRLALALGVRAVFVPTTWTTLGADFEAGTFDVVVGGVTVLPARVKAGDFSTVTYVDGKRPVARCTDQARYTSIAAIDRPEVRVVVNPGASNEAFARANFPHAQVAVHEDNPTVPDEIVAGRADVFVTDGIEVAHIAAIHPELCPTDLPVPFTRLEKAYWIRRDPALLHAVNAWLDGEIASGNWEATLAAALRAR